VPTTVITQAGILAGALYAFLTPSVMDARLSKIESVFQFYAIRYAKITFITTLPSSTTNKSLAFGIASDAGLTGFTTPAQVLELSPSMLTPAWQCASMVYTHVGTKVWECFASSAPALDTIQGLIYGSQESTVAGGTVAIGNLYIEYVVDFYEPGPVLSSVNLILSDLKERHAAEVRKRQLARGALSSSPLPPPDLSGGEATSTNASIPSGSIVKSVDYVMIPGLPVAQTENSAAPSGSGTWFLRR
jgi:hypothetical protein